MQQNWLVRRRATCSLATARRPSLPAKVQRAVGDWYLALCCLQLGRERRHPGDAQNRAKRKPTDYRSLRMPRETRRTTIRNAAGVKPFSAPVVSSQRQIPVAELRVQLLQVVEGGRAWP